MARTRRVKVRAGRLGTSCGSARGSCVLGRGEAMPDHSAHVGITLDTQPGQEPDTGRPLLGKGVCRLQLNAVNTVVVDVTTYNPGMLPECVAYFAASFRTVVELRIVAALPSAFSSSAPEKEDSLILPRRSQ